MPFKVDAVETLQEYLRAVLADAKHHAKDVDEIVLGLAGAIVSRKDPGSPLEVHSGRGGGMGRALQVSIKDKRYAFSYSHEDRAIHMKTGSYQGPVIHKFTNKTSLRQLSKIFREL